MPNTQPRRQHYLPRFYLEGFSREGSLRVYDRARSEYRTQTPLNTAVVRDLYVFDDKDGKPGYDIEAYFADLEGKTKPVIAKLDAGETPTKDEQGALAAFVAFLQLRTPEFATTSNEFANALFKRVNRLAAHSPDAAAAMIRDYEENEGKPLGLTPQELYEFLQDEDGYELTFHRNAVIDQMIMLAAELAPYYAAMNWVVLHAPRNKSFITSDNPFVLLPPNDEPSAYGVGILTPGAQKLIPLTQSAALVMLDRGEAVHHLKADDVRVRLANTAIARACNNHVIARDERLLRAVVRRSGIDRRPRQARFKLD